MDRNDVTWKGFFPALTTPFKRDGSLDENGWRVLLQLMLKQGMHGIVVAGTSGEWYTMTNSERKKLLEIAVEEIGGRIPVIAGISAFRIEDIVRLAQHAHKVGADGVLFTPTPYAVPSSAEVLAFYQAVSDRIDLPIIVYNWARGTGVEIDVQLAMQLAEVDKVVAIKYATKNRGLLYEVIGAVINRIRVFAALVNPIGMACLLQLGGDGFIAGGALLGKDGSDYFEAIWRNDVEKAMPIAQKNNGLTKALFNSDYSGKFGAPPATIKAAMNLMNQPGGYPRSPYLPIGEPQITYIHKILYEFGLITTQRS
jgi:dihydrodipicolinate synthase/N-acetylneuraminate lyase